MGSATTTTATGTAAHIDTGEGSGPGGLPVLLLHGWTGSKEDFAAVIPRLADRRRVLAPDLPGHGAAPPAADGDYSLAAHVGVVRALLDRAGIDAFHMVAHSHGGLIAQRVAYVMAQRVGSMTLIGSGLGALGDASREMVVRVAIAARDRGMSAAWAEVRGEHGGPGGEESPHDAFVRKRFLSMPPAAVVGVASNLVTAMPLGAFLHGIDFPVLVCHGEGDDTWLPHEQQLLARRIAGAAYRVIPDALHSPAVENPDGLMADLEPFLAAADATAGAGSTP
ncbi:alpha/beta hydrolase [soil metagenome]